MCNKYIQLNIIIKYAIMYFFNSVNPGITDYTVLN